MSEKSVHQSLKNQLLDELAELLSVDQVAAESAQVVELDQTRVGRLSRMDALQSQALSAETNRRRSLHINLIKEALQRIESGEYGDCEACGEAIDRRRLAANPAAAFCIECAGKAEL